MPDAQDKVDEILKDGETTLSAARSGETLEQFRVQFLGSKGLVKGLMDLLREIPREQKPAFGQRVNAVRDRLTAAYEARKTELAAAGAGAADRDAVDVTEPGLQPAVGNRHILMTVVDELTVTGVS